MTNALPFAIYLAPASIFQQDVRTRINHQAWCYIQLLQRVSDQSYAMYVAASYTDLLYIHRGHADENTENRVIVSTITRQDFHQHCRLIAAPTCERPLYAAPNCVLQDKYSGDNMALQLVASSAWLCYFRVLQIYADGFVQIRVAALPHRTDEVDRSYITTLSRDEFAQALPLEHDDLALSTCDLREKVEKYAQAISGQEVEHVRPVVPLDEENRGTPLPALAYPPEDSQLCAFRGWASPCRVPRAGAHRREAVLGGEGPSDMAPGYHFCPTKDCSTYRESDATPDRYASISHSQAENVAPSYTQHTPRSARSRSRGRFAGCSPSTGLLHTTGVGQLDLPHRDASGRG